MKNKKIKFPSKKISENFLDFSEPYMEALGEDASMESINEILKLTFTVWNAIVFEEVNGNSSFIDMMYETMKKKPETAEFMQGMISRKKMLFSDDQRLISDFKIINKKGGWVVRVETGDTSINCI